MYTGIHAGVTGFMMDEDVKLAAGISDLPLMVGVLASEKTLCGERNKWTGRYPLREQIADIFPERSERTLNLIHLSVSEQEQPNLADWLEVARAWGGGNCEGLQLNMPFPDPRVVRSWRHKHHDRHEPCHLILQCGARALAAAGSPAGLADRLAAYEGIVDEILIDASGGLGKELDPQFAIECFAAITDRGLGFGLGVAGGLSAESLQRLLAPIRTAGYAFSFDAEGKLQHALGGISTRSLCDYILASNAFAAS